MPAVCEGFGFGKHSFYSLSPYFPIIFLFRSRVNSSSTIVVHERIHEPSIHCTTVLEPFFLGPFSISLAVHNSIPCRSITEVSELRPPQRFLAFFCLLTIIIPRWCNFDRPESRTYEKRSGSTKTGSLRSKAIKSPVSTLLFRYVLGFPSYGFLWDRDFCVQSLLS